MYRILGGPETLVEMAEAVVPGRLEAASLQVRRRMGASRRWIAIRTAVVVPLLLLSSKL
jgi:hypothetical protein